MTTVRRLIFGLACVAAGLAVLEMSIALGRRWAAVLLLEH